MIFFLNSNCFYMTKIGIQRTHAISLTLTCTRKYAYTRLCVPCLLRVFFFSDEANCYIDLYETTHKTTRKYERESMFFGVRGNRKFGAGRMMTQMLAIDFIHRATGWMDTLFLPNSARKFEFWPYQNSSIQTYIYN